MAWNKYLAKSDGNGVNSAICEPCFFWSRYVRFGNQINTWQHR